LRRLLPELSIPVQRRLRQFSIDMNATVQPMNVEYAKAEGRGLVLYKTLAGLAV
jgi:hypothetical protein